MRLIPCRSHEDDEQDFQLELLNELDIFKKINQPKFSGETDSKLDLPRGVSRLVGGKEQ